MIRRDFYRFGAAALGSVIGLTLAIHGVAFITAPLRRKGPAGSALKLAKLSELEVGKPRAFPVIEEHVDAWVKYPKEPVGSVWLIRKPGAGADQIVAFTAECPHLGCAISQAEDAGSFVCRCHGARFDLEGKPTNAVPPRPMDTLAVELSQDADPVVTVHFQRFRTQVKEKTPLV